MERPTPPPSRIMRECEVPQRPKELQPYQQKVIDELEELNKKRKSLEHFCQRNVFQALPDMDKKLLVWQHTHMTRYADILERRIKRFK